MRKAREVIQLQIPSASSADIIVKPVHAGVFSHRMNSYVGTKSCVAVEHALKADSHGNATWKFEEEDGVLSAVRCLQIYLDKSQISLSANSFAFYSIYTTLLNFTENMRRKPIVSGALSATHLSAGFSGADLGMRRKVKRRLQRKNLHHCINHALKPLSKCAVEGLLCKTSDSRYVLLHLMIA